MLEALLLDDDVELRHLLSSSPADVSRRLRLPCAFTSCEGVTPLHVCSEFNCVRCARTLIEAGADVNARATLNANGFGGQTPIFHAVNSILNYCRPMLEVLVELVPILTFGSKAWCGAADSTGKHSSWT